jgi:hypothetical protein
MFQHSIYCYMPIVVPAKMNIFSYFFNKYKFVHRLGYASFLLHLISINKTYIPSNLSVDEIMVIQANKSEIYSHPFLKVFKVLFS